MSAGRRTAPVAVLLLFLGLAPPAWADDTGRLTGRLRLGLPGASIDAVGPIVVYLESHDPDVSFQPGSKRAEIRQQNARFVPSFRAIVAGQTVDMPNYDRIYHNVFSYSRPNDFDLGTYPAGESRAVTFDHPGIVKAYCSIHERMNATIFVAPNPWFAVVHASGDYVIEGVPPGRYTLRTWAERLPPTERELSLGAGESRSVDIALAGDAP
jgi:plastocyanin